MHRYYYRNEAVSGKDCDEFIDKYKDVDFNQGLVGGESQEELKYRKAKVHWLDFDNVLVRALWSYVLEMNQHFKCNINAYEKVQLTKYDSKCFYTWHQDKIYNDKPERKLTAVLQLSKPEDYKGCELQLFNGSKEPDELPIKNQGSIIVFKSYEWHRITELTDGTRYSLVMWATGRPLV